MKQSKTKGIGVAIEFHALLKMGVNGLKETVFSSLRSLSLGEEQEV